MNSLAIKIVSAIGTVLGAIGTGVAIALDEEKMVVADIVVCVVNCVFFLVAKCGENVEKEAS